MSKQEAIGVVGGGIVGLSIAWRLRREGHDVTVFEQSEPMSECSYGNAGYISEANIFPPISTAVMKRLPSLLFGREGPLVIDPLYLPKMLPWLLYASKVMRGKGLSRVMDVLGAANLGAYDHLVTLAQSAGADHLLSRDGSLVVYKNEAALKAKASEISLWTDRGLAARPVDALTLREMEPALSHQLCGGIHFPNSGRCANPARLGLSYLDAMLASGGIWERRRVVRVNETQAGKMLVSASQGYETTFDRVVIAAGHRSMDLLRPLGLSAPLVSERGYHLMLPDARVHLRRPVVFGEPHFAATPMELGLRLAGTAEFCRPDRPPRMNRATNLAKLACEYIPDLCLDAGVPWMGIRPSLPDAMPAVGAHPKMPGLIYAFGHGHNGLSLSAVTAEFVAALIGCSKSPINDIRAFSIERFC